MPHRWAGRNAQPLRPTSPSVLPNHPAASPVGPTTTPSPQLAACISGNDVLQDLAQLTDMIADILWCS